MLARRLVRCVSSLLWLFALVLAPTGCQRASEFGDSGNRGLSQKAELQAQLDGERGQLDLIALPTKSRYMAIHSFENWENPYITVQPGMLELHVTLADANPSGLGAGGMLRPISARRQVLDLSIEKLGEAVSAVPQSSWPYGRVIAIEEAHKTPPAAEPLVRRNLEATIAKLNDLGIIVYDPSEGKDQ